MVVLTAKVDFKKLMLILGLVAAALLALILFFGNSEETFRTDGQDLSSNDGRVRFLQSFGWEVVSSPKESGQVLIPKETNEVFERYNALQKCQNYDLSQFAGKKVMRYVYEVKNYPGATEPVYATLLVHKNKVIGGDVTNTAPGGKIQGFAQVPGRDASTPSAPTAPVPAEPAVPEAQY